MPARPARRRCRPRRSSASIPSDCGPPRRFAPAPRGGARPPWGGPAEGVMPLLDAQDPPSIERAAQALADGALVAFPTETVYGLGARADDDAAVARVFAAKGRPADHPLIVHVADAAAAQRFAAEIPPVAQRLMQAFWPGPLTVIVPRAPHLAAAAAGGQGTIGLRCPAHPLAHA